MGKPSSSSSGGADDEELRRRLGGFAGPTMEEGSLVAAELAIGLSPELSLSREQMEDGDGNNGCGAEGDARQCGARHRSWFISREFGHAPRRWLRPYSSVLRVTARSP